MLSFHSQKSIVSIVFESIYTSVGDAQKHFKLV